jgi:hypothetical protein
MCVYPILLDMCWKGANDSLKENRIVTNGQNIVLMKMNLLDLPGRLLAVVADETM